MTNKEAAWHLGTYSTTMGSGQTTDEQHNVAKRIAIKALEQELCREQDDYENEIEDLHNRLDIAEYDKERLREEVTRLEEKIKALEQEPKTRRCRDCKYYHTAWDGTETHYYEDYWCEWVEPNENDFCSLYEAKKEVSE